MEEMEEILSLSLWEKTLNQLWDMLPNFIFSLVILGAGWFLSKYITKLIMKVIKRSKIDGAAEYFFNSFILVTFRILVILVFLSQLGIDVTTMVTALGAATVTIGLALQDTLGNVASGVLLILTHPFKEGDYLRIGDDEGTVTKITLLSTRINTIDNKEIVIPNKNITSKSVINYSSNEERRIELSYKISYDNDIPQVKNIIRDVIKKDKKFISEKEILIGVFSQSDIYLSLDVKFWCKTKDYWDLYYKIQEEINVALEKNNVNLPYYPIHNKNI